MRDSAWAQRRAMALYAWAGRLVARLTDWILEAALAQIGEPMAWRDVELLARERTAEEGRTAEQWQALHEQAKAACIDPDTLATLAERLGECGKIAEGCDRVRREMATTCFRALAEKVDREIMAMGGQPRLRLVKKP